MDERATDAGREHETPEPSTGVTPLTRRRFRWLRLLQAVIVLGLLGAIGILGLNQLYQGPNTLEDVVAVMPGVPIFPLSSMAPRNRSTQRAMALPLQLMRMQGATNTEAALIRSPGETDFVVDWYLRTAPTQQWQLQKQDTVKGNTRIVFLRDHEGLQVLVGRSDGLYAPVQLVFIEGLTAKQRRELRR